MDLDIEMGDSTESIQDTMLNETLQEDILVSSAQPSL